jgi:hypothetical protein
VVCSLRPVYCLIENVASSISLPSTLHCSLSSLFMANQKGTPLPKAPWGRISIHRRARVPNGTDFWTDLALARCAYQSSSVIPTSITILIVSTDRLVQIELRAACLYAMKRRCQQDINQSRTAWDDMLSEMQWLREDYRCDIERMKILECEVAKPCADEARQRLQRNQSSLQLEDSAPVLSFRRSIPEWAREEYIRQQIQPKDDRPEPSSDGEEASHIGVISESSEPLERPKQGKRKAISPTGVRRSERIRNLPDTA